MVRAVLPPPASACIQGTVHSYQEQSRIQDPPDAWIASSVLGYHHHR